MYFLSCSSLVTRRGTSISVSSLWRSVSLSSLVSKAELLVNSWSELEAPGDWSTIHRMSIAALFGLVILIDQHFYCVCLFCPGYFIYRYPLFLNSLLSLYIEHCCHLNICCNGNKKYRYRIVKKKHLSICCIIFG